MGEVDRPDKNLADWRAIWENNQTFPVQGRPGPLGRLIVWVKKLLRPMVTAPQNDLWDRQRDYNLLIQESMESRQQMMEAIAGLGSDLQTVQQELVRDIHLSKEATHKDLKTARKELLDYLEAHEKRVTHLEDLKNEGFEEVMQHQDAMFAVVDSKLDAYRKKALELQGQLSSLLTVAEGGGAPALEEAVKDQGYLELERRHRGTEAEIISRIEPYLGFFKGRGEVLDLGCGRGEALELLEKNGIPARGVDISDEMVARCREKGLRVEKGDLIGALESTPEGSLGGVISFHVIEHLPREVLERLVRLSWKALAPGGVLVLETPSPLSVVVGARNFWLDPTHLRPVHPETLKLSFELAGFDQVERIDRQPFAASQRLPEISVAEMPEDLHGLADEINRLRDQLDALLYGFQDYGLVGRKPD
jgi:O-antigen chain-terminating methyltransferase